MKDIKRLGDISKKGFYLGTEVYPYKQAYNIPLRSKLNTLNDPISSLHSLFKEIYADSFASLIPISNPLMKLTK